MNYVFGAAKVTESVSLSAQNLSNSVNRNQLLYPPLAQGRGAEDREKRKPLCNGQPGGQWVGRQVLDGLLLWQRGSPAIVSGTPSPVSHNLVNSPLVRLPITPWKRNSIGLVLTRSKSSAKRQGVCNGLTNTHLQSGLFSGAGQAQSVERATLDLGVVGGSLPLAV